MGQSCGRKQILVLALYRFELRVFLPFVFLGAVLSVQPDQRRGASESGAGTVPTARVHRKEPVNLKVRYYFNLGFSFILG